MIYCAKNCEYRFKFFFSKIKQATVFETRCRCTSPQRNAVAETCTHRQTDRQTDVRIVVESCRRYSVYSSRSQWGPPARAVPPDDKLWLRAGTWQYFLADPARRRRRRRTLWQNAGHWFTAASTGRRLLKPTISTRYWRVTHDEPTHRRFKQTYTIQQHDATCAVFNRALKNEPFNRHPALSAGSRN